MVLYERVEDKDDNEDVKNDDASTGSDYADQYDDLDDLREFMDEQNIVRKTYTGGIHIESRGWSNSRMIPTSVLDNDLNLEADEIRCLDMAGGARESVSWTPRYTDSTLALRILVESLKELNRLDDVERFLSERIKRELRFLVQRAQEETYVWVERRRSDDLRQGNFESKRGRVDNFFSNLPVEIHCHFSKLLLSYENVLLRFCHLAQILRYKMKMDPHFITMSENPEDAFSLLQNVLQATEKFVHDEIKIFLRACLNVNDTSAASLNFLFNAARTDEDRTSKSSDIDFHEGGFFSLGIVDESSSDILDDGNAGYSRKQENKHIPNRVKLKSSVSVASELSPDKFASVLFAEINLAPDIRHALLFRSILAKWTASIKEMKIELAVFTGGAADSSPGIIGGSNEESALAYLDVVIERQLLPVLQRDAMDGTISALEREDAFIPILSNAMYFRKPGEQPETDLCRACQVFLDSTAPLFAALHQLPKSGELFAPLVAVMEHAALTFISRAKQRIRELCTGKTADALLGGGEGGNGGKETVFSAVLRERRSFKMLMAHYGQNKDMSMGQARKGETDIPTLVPSSSDTKARRTLGGEPSVSQTTHNSRGSHVATAEERDRACFEKEIQYLENLLRFSKHDFGRELTVCNEEELYHCACISHSLLKLSEQLDMRLETKSSSRAKALNANRALRGAIGTIRALGRRMANFCRINILIHSIKYIAKLSSSDALVSSDAARIPSCINDLGEYLAAASDNIHETGGNVIAAYSLSSLEQYIPLLLMRVVEIIGTRDGLPPWYGPTPFRLTLQGVETLARCCNMLQRDLKSVAYFEGSFWSESLSKDCFDHAADYISLLELDGDELLAYCRTNWGVYTNDQCRAMFAVNGPRRQGDYKAFDILLRKLGSFTK